VDYVKYKNTLEVCALENGPSRRPYGDKNEILVMEHPMTTTL
jgi:hypothetical protein